MVTPRFNPVLRSPVRRALTAVLASDQPFDLRHWLRFQTAPIAVCRQYAADVGLGCYTQAFGQQAERLFCRNAFRYYQLRDKHGAVDLWLANAGATYVHTFYRDGSGAISGLWICISPPLQAVALPAAYVSEALRALRWLLPWFDALPVTGPDTGLRVSVCEEEEADVVLTTGFYGRVVFDAIGAG